jgi:hypothetical protein
VPADGTTDALAARVLAPKRERLAEAWAVVRGWREEPCHDCTADPLADLDPSEDCGWCEGTGTTEEPWATTDPAEAWNALAAAGVIPMDAVDDPRRGFADDVTATERLPDRRSDLTGDVYYRARGRSGREETRRFPWRDFVEGRPGEATPEERARRPILLPHPATVADCVALAADWPGVLAAEEMARQHAHHRGWTHARVVWRVEPAGTPWAALAPSRGRVAEGILALGYALVDRATDGALVLVAPAL